MAEDDETTGQNGEAPPPSQTNGDGAQQSDVSYDEFETSPQSPASDDGEEQRTAHDLEPVFDVPVKVQAVLGRSNLEVNQLLKLAPGAVLELDRKVGEAIDIYVNNRLVARGEVVLVEDHLGVTMTEIVKTERG